MIFLLLFLIFLIAIGFLTFAVIYKRYFDFKEYTIIKVKPSTNRNYQLLINKMTFFISNLKSVPDIYGDFNVILDITNQNNKTSFNIIVPKLYSNDISNIVRNNFNDFELEIVGEINEATYLERYNGFMIFKTNNENPLIREESYKEDKLVENVKTILSSVKDGSFQIMLDFNTKEESFIDKEELEEVKIGNNLVSSNINMVKDIGVSFRFLSINEDFVITNIPSALGGILNLGGKTNLITKLFKNGSLDIKTYSLLDYFSDFFYTLFNTSLPRLKSFSPADRMFFSSKEISSMFCFLSGGNIESLNYKLYSPVNILNKQKELENELVIKKFKTLSNLNIEIKELIVNALELGYTSIIEYIKVKKLENNSALFLINDLQKIYEEQIILFNECKKLVESEFTKVSPIDFPGYENQYLMLHDEVLRRHTYIVGKTGTGKTTAIKVFIKDDIEKNRGFAVLDPNGDLAKEILDFIPEYRKDDVIVIDPSVYLGRINLSIFTFLRELKKYQKEYEFTIHKESQEINDDVVYQNLKLEDKLMSMIVQILKDVSVGGKDHWGARMDSIMKNVGSELLKYNISEILDLSSYLNTTDFRRNVIYNIDNQSIKEELLNFEQKDDKQREEAFQPVRNRFQIFLSETMRGIFSGTPEFSLKEMMDTGKIMIFRLPKGTLGQSGNLLGSIMIGLFWALAQTRISQDEKDRKDFTLYIDEVQNFITDSFSSILEEARKYRLRLVMANQFTKQIYDRNPQVYNSIGGNIGTFIALGIGHDDSQILSKYFDINALDMVNIPPLHGYVKCPMYGGETFNIKMEFIKQDPNLKYPGALHLMNLSHKKYGIKVNKKQFDSKFKMYREVIYKYLLKVKNFSFNTILFDLSINEKETLILLENLLLENLVLKSDKGNSYIVNIDLVTEKLNKIKDVIIEEELYYEFDYTNESVEEEDIVSLRSYYTYFKKLPNPNYIKDNFLLDLKNHNKSTNIPNIKKVDNSIISNNYNESDNEIDEDVLNKAVELLKEKGCISASVIQRNLGMGYAKATQYVDEAINRKLIPEDMPKSTDKINTISKMIDLPSDLILPDYKEESDFMKKVGEMMKRENKNEDSTDNNNLQNEINLDFQDLNIKSEENKELEIGDIELGDIEVLDEDINIGEEDRKEVGEDIIDITIQEKGKVLDDIIDVDLNVDSGDSENFIDKNIDNNNLVNEILIIEQKHPNLKITSKFIFYTITQQDVGLKWLELSNKLGFRNFQDFSSKIKLSSNKKIDFLSIINKELLGKKIIYTI